MVATVAALLALTLAGCGSGASTPTGAAQPTATTTIAATATATSLPIVDAASLPTSCYDMARGGLAEGATVVQAGGLDVSMARFGLTYPGAQIPQGTPNQPLALQNSSIPRASATPVNPQMKEMGGFLFAVCNASSSQSYTIQSVSVRVASFTPLSGSISAWFPCAGGTYDTQLRSASAGGCGGGVSINESLRASFSSDAGLGASATVAQTGTSPAAPNDPNPYPALPLKVAPGQDVSFNVGVTGPTTPGTYTFAIGVAVDAASPVYFSTTPAATFAPVAREWSGQNCTTSAMQAQIPPSTQHALYICPPAS